MSLLQYFKPLRNLLRIFTAERSPHQLALGLALGVLIGILPKGNLLAASATFLLFALRVNLGMGLTAIFLVSLMAPDLDRLTHGIGTRVLQVPAVYALLSRSYDLPLVPWTSLNNTVVVGSLLLGLLLMYPTYHIGRSLFELLIASYGRWRHRPALTPPSVNSE
jgi:uncharacterized protein (TIGR03546 family)